MDGWDIVIASDVGKRNGIGAELTNNEGSAVAEVFRCDSTKTVTLNTWGNDVPLPAIERLIQVARKRLGNFEDGTLFFQMPDTD